MPLTPKGEEIKEAMEKEYGTRGEQVFYASANKGTISGIERSDSTRARRDAAAQHLADHRTMTGMKD